MKKRIALLGTGLMGSRIAERLAKNGFQVSVYNRTKEKAKVLEQFGIKVFDSAKLAVADSDIVITMLSEYKAVNSVLFSEPKPSFKDKIVIQMGTIAPDENFALEKQIEKQGGLFLEAPVLGGITQAQSGELIVMVGSSPEQFKEMEELFSVIGNNIKLIGEVGQASALKLAYNQLIATMNTSFAMSLGYIMEKGIDQNVFMEILRGSTLYSPAFDKKLNNFVNRDYENTNFSLKLLLKDVNLMVEEMEKNRVDCLTLKGVKFLLERAVHFDLGDKDYSSLFEIVYPKK